ncbi:hypothetical protein N0V90_000119 [Kalmusia sp. IMI 367209]|nr:hypothetical protein N0V90_000119 [Kalmusia sp. IMI 367209]
MKGLTIPTQGAAPRISSDLPVPSPSPTQILVRNIYTAINPADIFLANMGLLVESWPMVPGCEASGVVVKAGSDAVNPLGGHFKEGDQVLGCVRIGAAGYSAWQEYFLLDAEVAILKPGALTMAQASTVCAGLLTAFLGVFGELGLLKSLGADATIDYKSSDSDIVEEVKRVTGARVNLAFDAISVNNDLVSKIFTAIPSLGERIYTTTNDWDPAPDASLGFITKPIELGPIGRPNSVELNKKMNAWIPVIYRLLDNGKLTVGEHSVEGEGIEEIEQAWEVQKSGKLGSTKVIVRVADE